MIAILEQTAVDFLHFGLIHHEMSMHASHWNYCDIISLLRWGGTNGEWAGSSLVGKIWYFLHSVKV